MLFLLSWFRGGVGVWVDFLEHMAHCVFDLNCDWLAFGCYLVLCIYFSCTFVTGNSARSSGLRNMEHHSIIVIYCNVAIRVLMPSPVDFWGSVFMQPSIS